MGSHEEHKRMLEVEMRRERKEQKLDTVHREHMGWCDVCSSTCAASIQSKRMASGCVQLRLRAKDADQQEIAAKGR